MHVAVAITQFFYAREMAPETQRWYKQKLATFRDWCVDNGAPDVRDINKALVREYLHSLDGISEATGKPLSAQTRHGHARAVRAFLRYCEDDEHIDKAPNMRTMMPKRGKFVKPVFTDREINALIRACKEQEDRMLAYRDRAIVAMLIDTGIRAGELVSLTLDRLQFTISDARAIVNGKGNKQRIVWLGKQARLAVHRYVTEFRPMVDDKHVFLSRRNTPLTYVGLVRTLQRLSNLCGVDVHSNPHKFRHTYAYLYKKNGGDVFQLSRLLGHSSVAITEEYLKALGTEGMGDGGSVLDSL